MSWSTWFSITGFATFIAALILPGYGFAVVFGICVVVGAAMWLDGRP